MKKTIKTAVCDYLCKHGHETEKMKDFADFICTFFEDVEETYPEIKEEFRLELEDFTYEMDEEVLCDVIKRLKFKDGTFAGLKWTKEEVSSVAKQYGVKEKLAALGKEYSDLKFWFAMNYVHATHYSVNRTVNGYLDLAIDEITNQNVKLEDLVKKILERL